MFRQLIGWVGCIKPFERLGGALGWAMSIAGSTMLESSTPERPKQWLPPVAWLGPRPGRSCSTVGWHWLSVRSDNASISRASGSGRQLTYVRSCFVSLDANRSISKGPSCAWMLRKVSGQRTDLSWSLIPRPLSCWEFRGGERLEGWHSIGLVRPQDQSS